MTITGKQKQTGLCYRAFKSDSAERADKKREIIFPRVILQFSCKLCQIYVDLFVIPIYSRQQLAQMIIAPSNGIA